MAPTWADAYSERGEILRRDRRYREALADHDKAIDLAPEWTTGYERRASVREDLEQWPEVLADLERYFTLGGKSLGASWSQANALAHLGRDEEALGVLETRIEEAPMSMVGHWFLAYVLFNSGRLDEALAAIDKAVEVEPSSGWGPLSRARYLAHKPGSCAQAKDDLAKVGELEWAVGREAAEMKAEEAMIRVFPLGVACPELVQHVRSLELARESVRVYPRESDNQQSLGVALYANERYEEANAALVKALDLKAKPDPTALFFLAMTESKLGRQADAHHTYDRALVRMNETWPKSPDLVLLKAEAARLIGLR
jgi:tetratricopeptide (TPR) repeat protein